MKGPPAPQFQVVWCKGKRWFACLLKEEKSVWPSSKPPVCVGKWKEVFKYSWERCRKPRTGRGPGDLRVGGEYKVVLVFLGLLPGPWERGVIPINKSLGLQQLPTKMRFIMILS